MNKEIKFTIDKEKLTVKVERTFDAPRDLVFDAVSAIPGAVCRKPGGAFYLCAKLPLASAEDFAVYLLEQHNVNGATAMVAPARA